jgi:hypothetical protein
MTRSDYISVIVGCCLRKKTSKSFPCVYVHVLSSKKNKRYQSVKRKVTCIFYFYFFEKNTLALKDTIEGQSTSTKKIEQSPQDALSSSIPRPCRWRAVAPPWADLTLLVANGSRQTGQGTTFVPEKDEVAVDEDIQRQRKSSATISVAPQPDSVMPLRNISLLQGSRRCRRDGAKARETLLYGAPLPSLECRPTKP